MISISIKQIHARPFIVPVRRNARSVYIQTRKLHNHLIALVVDQARHDIREHRLLIKQAKIVYKITKGQ